MRIITWLQATAAVGVLLLAVGATTSVAVPPEYKQSADGIVLAHVSPDCPVIYDNDWWTDVPDAAYIWAKASLGECQLKGNVITRCTFGWEKKYAHELKQQTAEAEKLLRLAKESGLMNVPTPVIGATLALRKPESGKVEDTKFERSAGSDLIVAVARRAKPDRPLLVFCGGSCTTVASAYLTAPEIVDRVVVFQIDGAGYNGSDRWAWDITMRHFKFANWARGYFWDKVSRWNAKRFDELPKNPLCNWLREHSNSRLGKANQWGDGAWIFWLYDHRCLTKVADYDKLAITIPKEGTNPAAMAEEFFRTMKNTQAYRDKPRP
jgi:hypothetical protein